MMNQANSSKTKNIRHKIRKTTPRQKTYSLQPRIGSETIIHFNNEFYNDVTTDTHLIKCRPLGERRDILEKSLSYL